MLDPTKAQTTASAKWRSNLFPPEGALHARAEALGILEDELGANGRSDPHLDGKRAAEGSGGELCLEPFARLTCPRDLKQQVSLLTTLTKPGTEWGPTTRRLGRLWAG